MNTNKMLNIFFFLYILVSVFTTPTLANAEGRSAEGTNTEDDDKPVYISVSIIRTEDGKATVGAIVDYEEKMDEKYLNKKYLDKKYLLTDNSDPKNLNLNSGWLLDISPDIEVQMGEEDSFNGAILKLTGNFIRFQITEIEDIRTPCSTCPFHVFPLSLGLESDRDFENLSTLLEFGYVPFYLKSKWKLGLKSKIGLFFQGGYKIEIDDEPELKEGGAVITTEEDPDNGIARLKLNAEADIDLFSYSNGGQKVSLVPRVRIWYDMVNSEIYHKYEATLKFPLGKDKTFDLKFEDGSGAPNFNEGAQFSTSLTIKY